MATSTAALRKVNCTHSNVCLPDVNCSWPMLLGGDVEEEREHHASHQDKGWLWNGECMFLCAMSHRYVAEGYTAYLCDVVQASLSIDPVLISLLSSPSSLLPSPLSFSLPSPPICPNRQSWIQEIQFGHDGRHIFCAVHI